MKTFAIELQNVKAMTGGNGLVRARVDAMVQSASTRPDDGAEPVSTLQMTEQTARVLFLLLKTQLGEIDKRKARSQR